MSTTRYSKEYFPAAPVLMVNITIPGEAPTGNGFSALVDTGSDGTFVPTSILEELDLPISYMTNVRAFWGTSLLRMPVHMVDMIVLGSIRLPGIEVVGDDWGSHIILGRNVLNMLRLHLDGPSETIGVSE